MKTNPLGDIRAENDHEMIDRVYYETPDYRSLIEEHTRRIVVGRRGTGKSAMFYKLQRHWDSDPRTLIIPLTPSVTAVIGLRPLVSMFGMKFSYLRAACNLSWQYAILQEILSELANHYKVQSEPDLRNLPELTRAWRRGGNSITERLFYALDTKIDKEMPMERRVATLAQSLGIDELAELAELAVKLSRHSLRIIADRLDEGYEPDITGVAILSGLVDAFDKLSSMLPNAATTLFLRDNIFRAIQIHDPDYSRNVEGDVLRLHWDEYHLFNMICNRLRAILNIDQEQNLKVWNKATERDLQGREGFRKCLRLTLYRPRDLVGLLNSAFNHARSHNRVQIVNEDIEASARQISSSRFDDLKKEYREVVPGIDRLLSAFASGKPVYTLREIEEIHDRLAASASLHPAEGQTLAIIDSKDIVQTLFSLGFLGVWKPTDSSYVFSHDGKEPDFSVDDSTKLLVHPCYWIGLNLREEHLTPDEAEEIHDDYDIEVSSETPAIRNRKLGQFINELNSIGEGEVDAGRFEDWCLRAVEIVFATGVVNLELHPNRHSTQRRDIVGRNTGKVDTWQRILNDYGTRQVIFEVKNYSTDLGPDEFRQMLSYLSGEYGKLGFIINRSKDANLEKDRELRWVREVYHEHERRVIVKLPAATLVSWLSKLRNPQKHDAPVKGLDSLLDTYERLYLRLGSTGKRGKKPAQQGHGSLKQ